MPNYPEQYFNQDTPAKNYSDINKAVIKEIEVSGSSTDNIYIARLVKLTGTDTINLQTGDVNVKLDHTGTNFDSTRIGDGVDLWAINADGSGKFSGSTVLYSSGGTSANVLTNNALLISGSTTLNDGTNRVDILTNNSLKISGTTRIGDGTRNVDILSNNSLRISGDTRIVDNNENIWNINPDGSGSFSGNSVIYGSGGTSVNVVNNHLLTSGITSIQDVNISSGHLKTSGITSISNVSASGNSLQTIITDNEGFIGAVGGRSKKPQIKIIRPGTTPTYGIGNIINSGGTLMEKFTIARSNDKNSWLVGGHMTSSVSATTALNADVIFFQSGFTITADNTNFDPSDANLEIYLGTLSFSTWKSMGNSSKSDGSVETPFILKPDAGTQDVYSVVQARNAYVASASEILTVNLDIAQD